MEWLKRPQKLTRMIFRHMGAKQTRIQSKPQRRPSKKNIVMVLGSQNMIGIKRTSKEEREKKTRIDFLRDPKFCFDHNMKLAFHLVNEYLRGSMSSI